MTKSKTSHVSRRKRFKHYTKYIDLDIEISGFLNLFMHHALQNCNTLHILVSIGIILCGLCTIPKTSQARLCHDGSWADELLYLIVVYFCIFFFTEKMFSYLLKQKKIIMTTVRNNKRKQTLLLINTTDIYLYYWSITWRVPNITSKKKPFNYIIHIPMINLKERWGKGYYLYFCRNWICVKSDHKL